MRIQYQIFTFCLGKSDLVWQKEGGTFWKEYSEIYLLIQSTAPLQETFIVCTLNTGGWNQSITWYVCNRSSAFSKLCYSESNLWNPSILGETRVEFEGFSDAVSLLFWDQLVFFKELCHFFPSSSPYRSPFMKRNF